MYPKLSRRLRALMIDSLVLVVVVAFSIAVGTSIGLKNDVYQSALILMPIILFEPVLVSLTGGNVGHHLMGIRIRKVGANKKINIFQALVRTFFKLFLGVPSLIAILTSKKRQAVHDFLSVSLVVVKDPASLPGYEVLDERTESLDYKYPGKVRRLVVVGVYLLLSMLFASMISFFSVSELCAFRQICSQLESSMQFLISLCFWVSAFVLPWLGWSGRLYGARRIRLEVY
ncbi:RDD family protein [Microbulbifer sp. JMSA004]|uniref:RDD family protein n=1 Tax=unclassified Microbulbifer TaxID=2619833 RepID=UPI00403AF0C3